MNMFWHPEVLWNVLMYMPNVYNDYEYDSFHCYADDTQLYVYLRPGETHQIEKLMEYIVDITNWMTSNFLLLNSEKNRGVNYQT